MIVLSAPIDPVRAQSANEINDLQERAVHQSARQVRSPLFTSFPLKGGRRCWHGAEFKDGGKSGRLSTAIEPTSLPLFQWKLSKITVRSGVSTVLQRQLDEAIAAAEAAAFDTPRWRDCIDAIAKATDAAGVAIFRPVAAPVGGALAANGSMVAGQPAYFDHWVHQDPWTQAANRAALFTEAGEVHFGSELLADEDYRRTAYFNEHGRHHDSGHKLLLRVCNERDPVAPVTQLSLNRSFKQAPFDAFEKHFLQRLWPHLLRASQAYALYQRMHQVRQLGEAALLGAIDHPFLALRSDLTVDFQSPDAQALADEGIWLHVTGGKLWRIAGLEASSLRRLLSPEGLNTGRRHLVAASENPSAPLRSAVLRLLPLAASPLHATVWPRAVALAIIERQRADDTSTWVDTHLRQRYCLTRMQCLVLKHVAQGLSVEDVAANLGTKVGTVRTHVSALRQKTGRKSLVDLVHLALDR